MNNLKVANAARAARILFAAIRERLGVLRRMTLLAAGLIAFLPGCSGVTSPGDPSIVLDKEHTPNQNVENGTAYDRATIDLARAKKVVLPTEAIVRRQSEAGKIHVLMAKRLAFGGHPSEAMSIVQACKHMGCAVRQEEPALVVAIYGEWDSGIEGGARVKLVAVVPDGLEVEQRAGLSKPLDAGRAWSGLSLPAAGWTAITDVPDPDQSAGK